MSYRAKPFGIDCSHIIVQSHLTADLFPFRFLSLGGSSQTVHAYHPLSDPQGRWPLSRAQFSPLFDFPQTHTPLFSYEPSAMFLHPLLLPLSYSVALVSFCYILFLLKLAFTTLLHQHFMEFAYISALAWSFMLTPVSA